MYSHVDVRVVGCDSACVFVCVFCVCVFGGVSINEMREKMRLYLT